MEPTRIVYTSFDRFPAAKGAATHITSFAKALGEAYGAVDLVTLPGQEGFTLPDMPGVKHFPLSALGENMVTRAIAFRAEMGLWWAGRRVSLVHVRSIYEGYPIAVRKKQLCDYFVYEANGFPSIELKYHHPDADEDDELKKKLMHQEMICLEAADLIITVSKVNAEHIISRGIDPQKIRIIPNGVDLKVFDWKKPQPIKNQALRVLYTGTMTKWQGVLHAIEAVQLYRRDFPAELILAGPCKYHERKLIYRAIDRLRMIDHVSIMEPMNQSELVKLMHTCDITLAPLPANDRNLEQGCCPLKVIEAMAAGTPLIASDMPVISALAQNNQEAILVRPSSSKAIKDGMLHLRENPQLAKDLSIAARAKIENQFTWKHSTDKLIKAYSELIHPP